MKVKQLIEALNEHGLQVFARKDEDGKLDGRTNVSIVDEEGTRFFVNRVATSELDKDGRPQYIWARGRDFEQRN